MRIAYSWLGLAAVVVAIAQSASAADIPKLQLPAEAQPIGYTLNLTIDPHAERFSGTVHIRIRLTKPAQHVWLHAKEIDINKAEVIDAAGKARKVDVATRDPSGVIEVSFGVTLPAQDIDLAFDYSAAFNAKLQGLYKVHVGSDPYIVTQMESISARYAFPGFDEPRFKVPFDITLTVPKDEVAIANTRSTAEKTSADGKWKTLTFATTKPLPTYLVAMAVGPWDVVDGPPLAPSALRKDAVPLRGVGPKGTGPQFRWILEQTPATVSYFEDYTHQPYPFDKLDLLGAPDFAAGAMENAGLIVYRDALLRIDAQSSANTYRASFNVNAHEVAHQWFGDLVTVPWWDDIWLNEAFATWFQGKATVALKPEFLGDLSRLEGTLGAMANDSLLSARKIRQPIKSEGDIDGAFDGITYQKGAAVLRMFEEWLGEDVYRDAMRDYLAKHRFGSGSSNDLIATIAKISGKGETLATAMRSFLDQPGIPLVHTELKCDGGKPTLALSQSRYLPFGVMSTDSLIWKVPVCVHFGRADVSSRQCFLLDQARREFAVKPDNGASGCPGWYMPNAEAAGYYRFTMAEKDFAALKNHVAALAPVEQLLYADAISSAFTRGTLRPDALLDAMPELAASDLPQIAGALLGQFGWIRLHLATDATRPALDAFAQKLYEPRAARLGLRRASGDSDATSRLRVRIVEFLAFEVRDKSMRDQLNALGRGALGLDGGSKVDLGKLDPDTRSAALRVAVQESGEPAYNAVLNELKTNHETQQRYELLGALGGTRDAKLGEAVRNYALTPDVAVGELFYIFRGHLGEPENRAPFWQWLKPHFDALRGRLPDAYQAMLPRLAAGGRCSKQQRDELQEWMAPRIDQVIGGERALAQSLEGVGQCTSLHDHIGEKALATWAEAHPAR
ncbi:MAG: M1 family metallopeptidase [Rudaea sp.]